MSIRPIVKTLFVFFCFIFFIIGCTKSNPTEVTIATAANMQFVMKEIVAAFEQETGISCAVIISSSGKLTAQIQEGAPYDIFVSADMKYPETLYTNGYTIDAPKIYGYGQIVLWSVSQDITPSLESLTDNKIEHIAIANPKMAPYGEAAISILKQTGIYDQISEKLVYGESISQTNQFITSGAAQIGFTAKSVVLSSQMKGKGHWIAINKNLYTPIAQGAVILKRDAVSNATQKFHAFLFSSKSKEILENFGYLANTK